MSSPRSAKPPDHVPEDFGTTADGDKATSVLRVVFFNLRILAFILLGLLALYAAAWALSVFSLLWDYNWVD